MSTTDPTTPLTSSPTGASPATSSPGANPTDERSLDPAGSPTSGAAPTADDGARPSGTRIGTMVWGLVLLLVGVAVAAVGAGATLDMQAVLIGLLLVSGTGLLVGSIIAARRRT